MKKRPILNAYETKIFNEWIADGNAVETEKGVWLEQTTQYRKKFTYEELQNFFKKEYLSYNGGGSAKEISSKTKNKKEKIFQLKAYNVGKIDYKINPTDEGLENIFKNIISKQTHQARLQGVNFDNNGATGTDAFKLVHIAGKKTGSFENGTYYPFTEMEITYESQSKEYKKAFSLTEHFNTMGIIEQTYPNWMAVVPKGYDYSIPFNLPTLYDILKSFVVSKMLNEITNAVILEFKTKDGLYQIGFNAKILMHTIESLMRTGIENVTGYFTAPSRAVIFVDSNIKVKQNEKDTFFEKNTFGLVMPIMTGSEEDLQSIRTQMILDDGKIIVIEFPIIRYISPNEYEIQIEGMETMVYSRGKSIQIKSKKTQPKATPQSTTKTTDKKMALGNKLRKGMVVRIEYKESNGSTLSNDLFFDDGKFIKYILITDKKGKELSETEETLSESELNEYYKEYKEYIIDEFYENMADGGQLGKQMTLFNTGGKIGFDALAKKVAKRYAGEKVEPQYQAEYGKKYSKSEAEEVGRKVAGKVYWQQQGRKFNGGGGVETVKKDRYGNEVRIGDAIRIKVLTGRYGQTKIYEGVVTNFGLFGKVELDGQRELTYTANYIHNDYEHGHHIWVEKINENDINENLRVPKKFVPSYSGTINGEKFGISGKEKFKEWLNENYPNSIFDSWYNLYNKGWRLINNEYVSPEKVPYTEVSVYESAETGQGFLYSLMIPKAKPQSTTKNTDKKTALGNKLRKGMVVRIEFKESNGSTLSNDLFFDDGKFIKYVLITDKKGKELSETEETLSESELNEYYKEYKEYIIDEFYENMAEGGEIQIGDEVEFSVPYFENELFYIGKIIELKGRYAVVEYQSDNDRILRTNLDLSKLKKAKFNGGGGVVDKEQRKEIVKILQSFGLTQSKSKNVLKEVSFDRFEKVRIVLQAGYTLSKDGKDIKIDYDEYALEQKYGKKNFQKIFEHQVEFIKKIEQELKNHGFELYDYGYTSNNEISIIGKTNQKMAEGGGVPNLNKMFHLPIEMAVYVPSTQDVNNVISVDEMDKRVREVKEYLANKFGGYTSAEKIGGFVDSQAELVNEEVVQITAFSTKEAYEENKEALVQKLSEWAKEWGQEAIGFEYEGDLMYVPQKFNGGGEVLNPIPKTYELELDFKVGQWFKEDIKGGTADCYITSIDFQVDEINGLPVVHPDSYRIEYKNTYYGSTHQSHISFLEKLKKEKNKIKIEVPYSIGGGIFFENSQYDENIKLLNGKVNAFIVMYYGTRNDWFNYYTDINGKVYSVDSKDAYSSINNYVSRVSRDGFVEKKLEKYREPIGGKLKVKLDFKIGQKIKVPVMGGFEESEITGITIRINAEDGKIIKGSHHSTISYSNVWGGREDTTQIYADFEEEGYANKIENEITIDVKALYLENYITLHRYMEGSKLRVSNVRGYKLIIDKYGIKTGYIDDDVEFEIFTSISDFKQKISSNDLAKGGDLMYVPQKFNGGGGVDDSRVIEEFRKGGNVSSIEKKVAEVNRLIELGNKNGISVIDSRSTWEAPMKYKPIRYSNGVLYIEYQQLDLYSYNRTGVSKWETKKDKILKRNMQFDNPLNDIAKMYRKALKQEGVEFAKGGDLMYVPQKFVGGGKAIRQTQFAVYKLLDKEGLVKYFTDTDLEKFLEEWNEDYNTDYEDFVEFNEYEREFTIKPVFSKNDMGGTASQPSFLEIQINDVTNWENYELANYLDAPISLVEKNRNFYVKEVQNEMMLNVIPNYAGGGSEKKSMENSPLKEYYEKYTNGGFVGGDIIKFKYDGKDFTRRVESVDEMGNAVVNIMKTQKATINPADVFEIKKEKDDKSIIIEKIGLNEENANFLIGLSPTFAVWLADSIVDAYTTIEGEQGLTREQSLNILNKNPRLLTQLRERIRGILDWLQHPTTRKQNLRELTFVEAERKAKEWHDELQTAGGDIDFVEPIENTVIYEYPENDNGVKYYWVFIPKGFCDIESARMGHCGRTGAGSLISLRSIRPYTEGTTITDSHVTIAYNKEEGLFYQSKGKRNAKPSEKYFPYIFDLIKMMASGQVTEKFKLSQKEKIKELEGQKIEVEKEVNKLQKYFESREAIEEDTNVLVDKAIIFQNEKNKLQNINSQIEKLNEESSFDFNGFGSEYQSSNDYGYEDMTNEQVKELYDIKPDMFNDFAGQFILYEAGLIDEKPNTSFLLEKDVDYVVDLLRVDRNTSDSLVTQVLSGETYDLIDAGYYYENAGDYVEQLKGVDYESVLDKIVEITGYDKEEVKENGAEYYLNGEDENFDSDSFDDIKRAIGNALAVATENDYAGYLRNQIVSALEELGTIEKLDDTGVVLNIDLSNLLSMSQISAISRQLESNSVEDIFFESESQGEIELPLLKIDDRYEPYPENWQEYFDINNYEDGGVIYQDLSKIKPMVVNDNTVLMEFELKKSKSGVEINDKIMNSDDVVNILRKIWEEDTINAYEQAYVLFLNKNNKVIGYYHHSNGGIDGTIMDVQMISGMAVKSLAKGVIIAHNHPSGSTNPSDADNKITKQLKQALDLFNIQLLDSIILTEKSYLSFANEGLI